MADAYGSGPYVRKDLRVQIPFRPFIFSRNPQTAAAGVKMYTVNKNARKRFTPIRSKRQKALRLRRFIIILVSIVLLAGAFFALKKAAGLIFNAETRPSWLVWHVKKINISGEEGDIVYDVEKYISFNEGDAVTRADASGLERILSRNLKELKSVSVWRNFFNGNLNIKIKKHMPFARLKTPSKTYLIEEGGLVFNDDKTPVNPPLFEVSVQGQIKGELLPKEFVELIKALKASAVLDIKEVSVDLEDYSFNLKLKSGFADMGGIKDGPKKLGRLKSVLAEAQRRGFKEPYDINFNYFDDGKIYLKPTA